MSLFEAMPPAAALGRQLRRAHRPTRPQPSLNRGQLHEARRKHARYPRASRGGRTAKRPQKVAFGGDAKSPPAQVGGRGGACYAKIEE